jgi:hypothetical protein
MKDRPSSTLLQEGPMPDTPWAGLVALAAMFVIPFLPDWLFEGPRKIKHWPRRDICGECGGPWTDPHTCVTDAVVVSYPPVRGELQRRAPDATAVRRRDEAG